MDDKTFLLETKEYIETMEVQMEREFEGGRSLKELFADGCFDDFALYTELLARIENDNKGM